MLSPPLPTKAMPLLLTLLATVTVYVTASSSNFVPLSLGPDFQSPFSETDILRGFKLNINEGESAIRPKIFEGNVKPIPFKTEFGESAIIKSTKELTDMLEIEGSLSVSYGPMISGSGSGRYLDSKVNSKRSATILYRTRRVAYARSVDATTIRPADGVDLSRLRPDEISEVYGTKFIDQMLYGAQLDVILTVTSTEDIDLREIEAELEGKIGVGPLSVGFSARFSQTEGSAESVGSISIQAQASGVNFNTPPNPTFNETNQLIRDFNNRYSELIDQLGEGDTIDEEDNVLNELSPVGFTVSSIADYTDKLDALDLAVLDSKMEDLRDVFFSALFWKSRLQAARDIQEEIFSDPRDREEIFQPYSNSVDLVLSRLDDKVDECLSFRRLPIGDLLGWNGKEPTPVPVAYPDTDFDRDITRGLVGDLYIASPVTLLNTRFPDHHYIGFALPMDRKGDGSTVLTPWMGGALRSDDDNSVLAAADTTLQLERAGFLRVDDIQPTSGFEYVKYGDVLHIQNYNLDFRWLTGARSGNGKVLTRNKIGDPYENMNVAKTYEWVPRSSTGSIDSQDGSCVRYGDLIYLRTEWSDSARRYLCRGHGEGSERAGTTENPTPTRTGWIVRSTVGSGSRDLTLNPDPAEGVCVQTDSLVFLQNNEADNRWMNGGRGTSNEIVDLRDIQSNGELSDPRVGSPSYRWVFQSNPGNGFRNDGFYCGAHEARGYWSPLADGGVGSTEIAQGITGRDADLTNFWGKTSTWEESVQRAASGPQGFPFGSDNLEADWLAAAILSDTARDAIQLDGNPVSSTVVPSGKTAWQFVYEVSDICDGSWDLKTSEVAFTDSPDEPPCCLPGLEADPEDPHSGPCRLLSPCQCSDSVCNPPITISQAALQAEAESGGGSGSGSNGGGGTNHSPNSGQRSFTHGPTMLTSLSSSILVALMMSYVLGILC